MKKTRDFSVYAIWIVGQPTHEYAKVRVLEGVMVPGKRVEIQRVNQHRWLPARIAESPAESALGSIVYVTLEHEP